MGLEIMVINFDGMLTKDNHFLFFDPGPALTRTGYHIDDHPHEGPRCKEQIITAMLEFYRHIYVITVGEIPLNAPPQRAFDISESFFEDNASRLSFHTLKDIVSMKTTLDPEGVIVINFVNIRFVQSFNIQQLLAAEGIQLPVANNSMMHRIFTVKPEMADIFSEISPEAIPAQCIIDFNRLPTQRGIDSQLHSDYVVFKPIDGTRASGIVVVPRQQCLEILKWLANKKPGKFQAMPCVEEGAQRYALIKLDEKCIDAESCILQECITPAVYSHHGKKFHPTIRIVVVCCYNPETQELSVRMPVAYYKFPEYPIADPHHPRWRDIISFHAANRIVQESNPLMRAAFAESSFFEKPAVCYPSSCPMPNETKALIAEDVQRHLLPVLAYLFTTSPVDYYASRLKGDSSFYTYLRRTIKLHVHKSLDESLCLAFQNGGLNVPLILLYRLVSYERYFRPIHPEHFFPKEIIRLCIRFQDALGPDKEQSSEELQAIAKHLLAQFDVLFAGRLNSQVAHTFKTLLEKYQRNDLNFIPVSVRYEDAVAEFKQGHYIEATELFLESNDRFPAGSKEQAICTYSLASCYIKQELYQIAERAASDAVALHVQLIAMEQMDTQQLERASKKLEQIRQLIEADKIANIGLAAFKGKNYTTAIESFHRAIDMHQIAQPESVRLSLLYYNLASAYDRQNNQEKAVPYCKISAKMRERLLGADHEKTKIAYDKLASLQIKRGEDSCSVTHVAEDEVSCSLSGAR